jgi:hypothetical protein
MSKENYFTLGFGIVAIILMVVQIMNPVISPNVGWSLIGIFGALAIFFFIMGIGKKENQESLVLTPHTYTIGLSGMTDYPDKPDGAYWLRLDISTNAINKAIDTLDLIIEGKSIPANQWHSKIATSFTACFNVTDWKWKHIIQVDLQARIKGDVHSLVRIPVDFDIEPGGFPRYL